MLVRELDQGTDDLAGLCKIDGVVQGMGDMLSSWKLSVHFASSFTCEGMRMPSEALSSMSMGRVQPRTGVDDCKMVQPRYNMTLTWAFMFAHIV